MDPLLRRVVLVALIGAVTIGLVACPKGGDRATPDAVATIEGRVTAGPTCPVQRDPPASECADRPVEGAVIVIVGADGGEIGRTQSDEDGSFSIGLSETGELLVQPQPVDGLMGTAAPISVSVEAGETASVDIAYDTGIR